MSRYRKLETAVWGDARFLDLSPQQPSGQSLWLYLILGPHTTSVPGLFRAGEMSLAEAIGWSLEDLRRCWQEIEQAGMARANWKLRVVWLPKAIRHNEPANAKALLGWRSNLAEIPECDLKREACQAFANHLSGKSWFTADCLKVLGTETPPQQPAKSAVYGMAYGIGYGMPFQEQEQEIKTPYPLSGGEMVSPSEGKENQSQQAAAKDPHPSSARPSPEQEDIARRVIAFFGEKVKSPHSAAGAEAVITSLLQSGITEDRLRNAAVGYGKTCDRGNIEFRHRQGAKRFYGPSGRFLEFKDWGESRRTPPKNPTLPKREGNEPLPSLRDTIEATRKHALEVNGSLQN